jgi:Uma2 family endonuclease
LLERGENIRGDIVITNLKQLYTLEEYLELDRQSEERLEFWNGEVFNMSGVSLAHAIIEMNIATYLTSRLGDKKCQVFPANMRIKVPSAPPYRYGDLSALCGEAESELIGGVDALRNPSLIIEVLSESTEKYDFDVKFKQYQSIESFREYLLVRQDCTFVTQFVKRENGEWVHRIYDEVAHAIRLESIECEILLSEIYRNITFPQADGQTLH